MNAVDQRVCKFCRTVLTVTVTNQQPLGLIAGFAGEKEIRIIEIAENATSRWWWDLHRLCD